MEKALIAAWLLTVAAAPACANPVAGSGGTALATVAIALLIVVLGQLSGGRAVLRASGQTPWGWGKCAGFVIVLAPLSGLWGPGFPIVVMFGLWRAGQLIYWSMQSWRPPEQRPPHLARASAGRLIAGGTTLGILTVALTWYGCLDWAENSNFAVLVRKSNEGATKGNLGSIREALKSYRGEAKGRYPKSLDALSAGGKYLPAIPAAKTPRYHPASTSVRYGKAADDAGGWLYDNIEGDADFGAVWVNCTHTDSKGSTWTAY